MMQQYIANGITTGAEIGILALGFGLIYRTTGILHFAHAAVFLVGAYSTLAVGRLAGAGHFFFAVCLGALLGTLAGVLTELFLYRPLRYRGTSGIRAFVASLGLYLVLQNCISLGFGDDPISFFPGATPRVFELLGARITSVQLTTVFCFFLVTGLIYTLAFRTRIGISLRAVASDAALAKALGIRVDVVYVHVLLLGSVLAALAGILVGWNTIVAPGMGITPLMLAIVAVIVGGESLLGPAVGGFALGLALQVSIVWIPTRWQEAVAFVVLLAFVSLRGSGPLHKRWSRTV